MRINRGQPPKKIKDSLPTVLILSGEESFLLFLGG